MSIASAAACSKPLLASVRSLDLFLGVTDEAWADASADFRTEYFRNGDVICTKGDPAEALFIVWEGQLTITDGTHITTRRVGEIVGEQALIQGIGRGATITACGPVQLIVVPMAAFDLLLGPHPFARNLLRAISSKLNQATAQRALRFAREELLFGEFRAHLSLGALNALLAEGDEFGRPRVIDGVVLLSDIRGFSARASRLLPIDVAGQIGRYLDHAVDVVHQHGGLVDKFIGDAILAVWGWPSSRGDEDVAAAFRCAKALAETSRQFTFGDEPVEVGVGLSAGRMFVGNVGSSRRRQFTVLGEVVNLAAHFESLSKEIGEQLVVGEAVYNRLPADLRTGLTARHDQRPKGSASQTVYSGSGSLSERKSKVQTQEVDG